MSSRNQKRPPRRWWVKYLNLQDARIYLVLVVFTSVSMLLWRVSEPSFVVPTLSAALACLLPMKLVRYDFLSFITLSAITHAGAYPMAALLGLALSEPTRAIEKPFWDATPYAMWASVVGMIGLATGALLMNGLKRRCPRTRVLRGSGGLPSVGLNFVMVLLVLPVVAVQMYTGFYYHGEVTGVEGYNFEAADRFGFLGYLVYLGYCGVVLQIRRYTITQARSDGIAALAYVLIVLGVFIPSGSRVQALVVIPLALFTFMAWEKRTQRRVVSLIASVAVFLVLILAMQFYREMANISWADSMSQRLKLLGSAIMLRRATSNENPEFIRLLLARRAADYIAPGYLISIIPSTYPYRGFEDVDKYLPYLLPSFMRPETDLKFEDGAVVVQRYGIRLNIEGSSPIMILGDLYSRFGWPGIFFGMTMIGILLRWLDFRLRRWRVFDLILFTFLFQQVVTLLNLSLLRHIAYFTRSLLIITVISFVVSEMFRIFAKTSSRSWRVPIVIR